MVYAAELKKSESLENLLPKVLLNGMLNPSFVHHFETLS